MENVAQNDSKITEFLKQLIHPKFEFKVDKYLDKLLDHLSVQEASEELSLINLPIFSQWIVQAVSTWSSENITPTTEIAAFSLNLAGLLSKSEKRFCDLNNGNFFIKLVNVLKARHQGVADTIKLAYIKLLLSFLEHKSGTEWMIACSFWEDVFRMSLASTQDESVLDESYKFMTRMLDQTIDHDEAFCSNVVKRIMQPLDENIYKSLKASTAMTEVPDETVSENLKPTLNLIGSILECSLEAALECQKNWRVPFLFLKIFHLDKRFSDFILIAQNKHLFFELGKISYLIQFLELYFGLITNKLTRANAEITAKRIMDHFWSHIYVEPFEDAMRFCDFGQFYWKLMKIKIYSPQSVNENEAVSFANQLLLMQLMPYYGVLGYYCPELNIYFEEEEEVRDMYFQKILDMCTRDSIRCFYFWRDRFMDTNPDIPKFYLMSYNTLSYVKKSLKHYPRERGVIVVQELIYMFKDTVAVTKKKPEILNSFHYHFKYFEISFELLSIFIEKFHITWKDGFETIDLLDLCFELITLFMWPKEVAVQILKLINVSLAQHMTASLALLVDRTEESTLILLGPVLFAKLHDCDSDIKIGSLEIVSTMSRLSRSEFTSLQKVIMDSKLPHFIIQIIICDGDALVKPSAIKCLQEMILIDEIWNNVLSTSELLQNILKLLHTESEKQIRLETAKLMSIAYKQQRIPKAMLNKVFEIMVNSSRKDLHWEVRLESLLFWNKVIEHELYNQGMIDGSFPDITFSKEQKKIVILTHSEIRRRLLKILEQLNAMGCLEVLVVTAKSEYDRDVARTAINILQTLEKLFKKYDLISYKSVIDKTSHLNYRNVKKNVTPEEFLCFCNQDFEKLLTEKKNMVKRNEDLNTTLKQFFMEISRMDCM